MAPEQAEGRLKEVGPATDVYALGAILYEAMTGRPPFEGESMMQTLDRVRYQEPVSPSHLQSGVPADLEAICLHCLEKEPHNRYPGANALADDLDRFQQGKPVRVGSALGRKELAPVPGYEVWEELAAGGVWVVHKARELRGKRLVALKRVRPGSVLGVEHLGRLRATAEAARALEHPNIAAVLDVGGTGQRLHLAVELVEGGGLPLKLGGRPLPPADAARLVELLADALHHAHERGLVHCHLNLSCVLLAVPGSAEGLSPVEARLGVPKLIGFEMARRGGERGALEGLDPDRLQWQGLAPEQLFNKPEQVGRQTDVYALGVILYELLTGRPPYRARTTSDLLLKVGFEILPQPRFVNPDVGRALNDVCMTCLEQDPRERYATAAELAEDLRRYQRGERPVVSRPRWWERLRDWLRTRLSRR
jgi:serine/threonine protein kinase